MEKQCIGCKIPKKLEEFYFKKTSNYHSSYCKECERENSKKYRIVKKEQCKIYNKQYKENKKQELIEKNKIYYQKNKEKRTEYSQKYHANNREINNEKNRQRSKKLSSKLKRNERLRNRKKNDIIFKLRCDISRTICDSFKKNNLKKTNKSTSILGCTFPEFKIFLESQFEVWMNWSNHGCYTKKTKTWQLDHIIPISSAKTKEDLIRLNHFSNFRPLESLENLLKSNKKITL